MFFTKDEISQAILSLSENYYDEQCNNNKTVGTSKERKERTKSKYNGKSMKRSNIQNIQYTKCEFYHNAFTGSTFNHVLFRNCTMAGNSFATCNFYTTTIKGELSNQLEGNNFSQSNFIQSYICDTFFCGSGLLQTLFTKCKVYYTTFRSCTLEGCRFINCILRKVDFGNTNIEFADFINSDLTNVTFPFYQFPYIIGAADFILSSNSSIILRTSERDISLQEYKSQLDNLIKFFYDKAEYFPICNLQIAQKNLSDAKESLLSGINCALEDLDFRMIRHYCRLAKRHNLLDEFTVRRIIEKMENELLQENILPEHLNNCIIHMGEIRQILLSGSRNAVNLNLRIRTNIRKDNKEGINYVNALCNEITSHLSNGFWGQEGFQIAVANHSPYEIIIDVITSASAIVSIAKIIWDIIEYYKANSFSEKNILNNYQTVDLDNYKKYINTRIELCKEQLLRLNEVNSKRKMNHYIEEITQNLQTDLNDLYDNNILIYKKKNDPLDDKEH